MTLGNGLLGEPIIDHLLKRGAEQETNPALSLFTKPDFLSVDICEALISQIDAVRRPSTIADSNGDPTFRTSETGDLSADDPIVMSVERAFTEATGLSPEYGEPLQGQRYAEGQEFKPHTDYFGRGSRDYDLYCSLRGDRTWTLMVYLNEPLAGGETYFNSIRRMIFPQTGKLVAWNNRYPDGNPNPYTVHHGRVVTRGVKYVITKWYRERL